MKIANLVCLAIAALTPVFCWIDRANYGPHSPGMSYLAIILLVITAVLFALLALVRCKWALLIGCAAIIASAILCGRMTADWTYCPECRAMLSCIRLL